jgi:hypothetical protein
MLVTVWQLARYANAKTAKKFSTMTGKEAEWRA